MLSLLFTIYFYFSCVFASFVTFRSSEVEALSLHFIFLLQVSLPNIWLMLPTKIVDAVLTWVFLWVLSKSSVLFPYLIFCLFFSLCLSFIVLFNRFKYTTWLFINIGKNVKNIKFSKLSENIPENFQKTQGKRL